MVSIPEAIEKMAEAVPMGRLGQPRGGGRSHILVKRRIFYIHGAVIVDGGAAAL